jgi:hypothetical protein
MFGKMKSDIQMIGTSLSLKKGQLVTLLLAENVPQGGYFALPRNGKWADGISHNPDDSILITTSDFEVIHR